MRASRANLHVNMYVLSIVSSIFMPRTTVPQPTTERIAHGIFMAMPMSMYICGIRLSSSSGSSSYLQYSRRGARCFSVQRRQSPRWQRLRPKFRVIREVSLLGTKSRRNMLNKNGSRETHRRHHALVVSNDCRAAGGLLCTDGSGRLGYTLTCIVSFGSSSRSALRQIAVRELA